MNILNKISIGNKLRLLSVAFILPIIALLSLFVMEKNKSINFAEAEITGVEYIVPLKQFLLHIAEHRGSTNALLKGNESVRKNYPAFVKKLSATSNKLIRLTTSLVNNLKSTTHGRPSKRNGTL